LNKGELLEIFVSMYANVTKTGSNYFTIYAQKPFEAQTKPVQTKVITEQNNNSPVSVKPVSYKVAQKVTGYQQEIISSIPDEDIPF
jgi:hypothetical protein